MDGVTASGATTGAPGLPLGYKALTPLYSEQHGDLTFRRHASFAFARAIHAAPIAADEAGRVQAFYPFLFAPDPPYLPVALFSMSAGANDFVDADGAWRRGVYVPAYFRRYPFALLRENRESERMLLCADLTAPNFAGASDAEKLFEAGKPSAYAREVAAFCTRYEQALARTRAATARLAELGLFDDARAAIERPGARPFEIDGFKVVSEDRLHKLDDAALAGLVRGGLAGLVAAHRFSLARLPGMELETVSCAD